MTSKADLKKPAPPKMPEAPPPPPKPRVPWAERVAAYDRVKPRLLEIVNDAGPREWPRERWIAHWLKMRANPDAPPYALAIAAEALKNLGYREPRAREPGEDDEPAWQEPADGAAGDITQRAPLALGIPEDPLEADFRTGELRPQARG